MSSVCSERKHDTMHHLCREHCVFMLDRWLPQSSVQGAVLDAVFIAEGTCKINTFNLILIILILIITSINSSISRIICFGPLKSITYFFSHTKNNIDNSSRHQICDMSGFPTYRSMHNTVTIPTVVNWLLTSTTTTALHIKFPNTHCLSLTSWWMLKGITSRNSMSAIAKFNT